MCQDGEITLRPEVFDLGECDLSVLEDLDMQADYIVGVVLGVDTEVRCRIRNSLPFGVQSNTPVMADDQPAYRGDLITHVLA